RAANTDASAPPYALPVATQAPDTSITANPPSYSNSTSPSFSLSFPARRSSDLSLTFECSLDGAAFAGCTSPQAYSSLTGGNHTIAVRHTSQLHNPNASAAHHARTVDTQAPDTSITANPPAYSNSTAASFSFTGT